MRGTADAEQCKECIYNLLLYPRLSDLRQEAFDPLLTPTPSEETQPKRGFCNYCRLLWLTRPAEFRALPCMLCWRRS